MAIVSEANEALLQTHEENDFEFQNENQETGIKVKLEQVVHILKEQKSFEILKSAVTIVTSNTKLTYLLILSMVPFIVFMVIYELNIYKLLDVISEVQPSYTYYYAFEDDRFQNDHRRERFRNLVQLFPFYLVLTPLIELFGLSIIINVAAAIYSGEKETSLKETLYEFFYQKNKFKGPFVTSILVQLLSSCTLVGLFWTLADHYIITSTFYYFDYTYFTRVSDVNVLSIGVHAILFVALLYKYLDWSAMWNMSIVISVLEEETGIEALEMSSFFGKRSRKTGSQLMLVWFVYSVVVRLPLLLGKVNDVNVGVIVIVLALLSLGNLVKWIALVLYYYDCKAQTMLKKVDEEVGKGKAVETSVV